MPTACDTGTEIMWLRVERRPAGYRAHVANDTMKLSHDNTLLFNPHRDKQIAETVIHGAKFRHVFHILSIAHDTALHYHWCSLNCWYFADIVISTLHAEFRGRWLRPPKDAWTEKVVKRIGHNTSGLAEAVGRAFHNEYRGVVEAPIEAISHPRRAIVRSKHTNSFPQTEHPL